MVDGIGKRAGAFITNEEAREAIPIIFDAINSSEDLQIWFDGFSCGAPVSSVSLLAYGISYSKRNTMKSIGSSIGFFDIEVRAGTHRSVG